MKKRYGTSVFAKRVGCSEGTARDLDRRGIVKPSRTESGQRRFNDEDVRKAMAYLARIGRLRVVA
jgi:DNA-binding transcriptional MerR regulator